MTFALVGLKDVKTSVDKDGYRDHTLTWEVVSVPAIDGFNGLGALYASGMPVPGAALSWDPYAYYMRQGTSELMAAEKSRRIWKCSTTYTNRPMRRCETSALDNPLLEPPRFSGGTEHYTAEATKDKDGDPILNSSNEIIRGRAVERDFNRPTLQVEQNVSWINMSLLCDCVDCVNDGILWGLSARELKLNTVDWEQVQNGSCGKYFKVRSRFGIKKGGWNHTYLDQGRMIKVAGANPEEFKLSLDRNENPVITLLDGNGNKLGAGANPVIKTAKIYSEVDFVAKGWPATAV